MTRRSSFLFAVLSAFALFLSLAGASRAQGTPPPSGNSVQGALTANLSYDATSNLVHAYSAGYAQGTSLGYPPTCHLQSYLYIDGPLVWSNKPGKNNFGLLIPFNNATAFAEWNYDLYFPLTLTSGTHTVHWVGYIVSDAPLDATLAWDLTMDVVIP